MNQTIWVCLSGFAIGTFAAMARSDEIHDAVRRGDVAAVKAIIALNPAAVHVDGKSGISDGTALHIAVENNNEELVRLLLASKADPNARAGWNKRPPVLGTDNPKIVRLLLDAGAGWKPEIGKENESPLKHAAQRGWTEAGKALVEAGAPLDIETAVELGWTERVAEILKDEPRLAKRPNKLLHTAAHYGHLDVVRLLLQFGSDPNLDYGYGNVVGPYTPLTAAVNSGRFDVARTLSKAGANGNVSAGKSCDNLLISAMNKRDTRYFKLLIEHGADVQRGEGSNPDLTPLHLVAASSGVPQYERRLREGELVSMNLLRATALDKAKLLFRFGADLNATTKSGATPLLIAAIAENLELCTWLRKSGAKVDIDSACVLGLREEFQAALKHNPGLARRKSGPLGQSLLHWAAARGNAGIAELLLANGADPDAVALRVSLDQIGDSLALPGYQVEYLPLGLAAAGGHIEVARLLLKNGAQVDANSSKGWTALQVACSHKQTEFVRLLIRHGARVHGVGRSERSPLFNATGNREIVEMLLAAGAEINPPGAEDGALIQAALSPRKSNNDVAELLFSRGAKLNLRAACALNKPVEVARILDANPKAIDENGNQPFAVTPIKVAIWHDAADTVELLIRRGVPFLPKESKGESPFHYAAENGGRRVAELLLEKGVSVDDRDQNMQTALHRASSRGQLDLVQFLVSRKADVNAKDDEGRTPAHLICRRYVGAEDEAGVADQIRRNTKVAQLLVDAGANLSVRSGSGQMPIHCAAESARLELVQLFVEKGADINARDWSGKTALSYALGKSRNAHVWFDKHEPAFESVADFIRKHGGVE